MKSNKVQKLLLERYILGEVSEEEKRKVEEYLQTSVEWKKALEEIKASNAEFEKEYPAHLQVPKIHAKLHQQKKFSLSYGIKMISSIAAVFLVGFFLFTPHTRIKGNPHTPALVIYQKTPSGVIKLREEHTNLQNDVLQIAYVSAGKSYGMIFSIDGNGTVTRHLPNRKFEPVRLKTKGEHVLAQAYQLDDAPKIERFFFLCSDAPFSGAKVRLTLRKVLGQTKDYTKLTHLPLFSKIVQTTFTVIKEEK